MSPEGLITSEFDDAAIIDGDVDAAAAAGADPDDLADLEVVVLDLTGTTVVDDRLIERAFERAADAAGIAESDDEFARALAFVRATTGRSTIAVFRALSGDEDQAQHANAVFESSYAEFATDGGVRAVPGAEQLIRRLRAIGVTVVLTTGLSRATADAVLDAVGWRDLADFTLTPADAGRGGPYPDLPLTALLRAGASSVEGMVVVGDTTADIASGLAAGAGLVVGVLTGSADERALTDAGADAVVGSVSDLGELLGLDDLESVDGLDDDFDEFDAFDEDEPGADGTDLDGLYDPEDVDDPEDVEDVDGADDASVGSAAGQSERQRPEGQTLR